jgi:hypothetical protein
MTIRKSIFAWRRVVAIAILALVMAPTPALSQSDSTTGQISATIASSFGLNDTSDMSFGWMARPASPGVARLGPANNILSTGLSLLNVDSTSPAKIVISGMPNQTVGLLVGDLAKFGKSSRRVSVSGFTHNGGPMPALGPDGQATIELGATLHLAANAHDGRYRGVFDVIVSNN